MKFSFITLFPETIHAWLTSSIIGRARTAGLFEYEAIQLRDFATGPHRTVDDVAYGGGGGMVLKVEPLVAAVEATKAHSTQKTLVVAPTPGGRLLNQELIHELQGGSEPTHYILVCGHYEGLDQRFLDHWVDLEVSLGNFVVSGGELPALVFADALIRGVEGSLGNPDGYKTESFQIEDPDSGEKLVEYPHYTRPAEFRSLPVPPVLLQGNHKAIAQWRLEQSRLRTAGRSFDKPPRRSDTPSHV